VARLVQQVVLEALMVVVVVPLILVVVVGQFVLSGTAQLVEHRHSLQQT
jgi:hypothetical protein